jgi:hypothetical protein
MRYRRWPPALMLGLRLWCCIACGGRNGASDYADNVATEVERHTVPPGAFGLSFSRSVMKPCVIRSEWTFATSWDRATYAEWLKAQLAPRYTVIRDALGRLEFSRHDGGDTHSLTIEAPSVGDGLHVRATLCVFPD